MPKIKDITNQQFGHLRALRLAGYKRNGDIAWICLCVCGNTPAIEGGRLRRGLVKSCGCMQHKYSHGLAHTKAARVWHDMMYRCYNPDHPNYPNYGARGIKVCDRWHDIKLFYEDMGEPDEGFSLERINNNGNYEPSNCKWALRGEQLRNKRTNRKITAFGKTLVLADWAKITGFEFNTLRHRIVKLGEDPESALTRKTRRGQESLLGST